MTLPTTETALQREQRLFGELFARLIDSLVNSMFDLRPEKALRRSSYLMVLFLFSGFLISIIYYPLPIWIERTGKVLAALLSTTSSPAQFNATLIELFTFLWDVISDPRIIQYLPVFLSAFFIAQQSAAMYLADVFELQDVGVARSFISSVALSGSNETIHIKQGEIADESRDSPVYLIGGPGKVVVELDSVALFERANGTPHVIGPTGREPGGKATLEGFERYRQALDIRNHHVDLRDQDDKSKAVKSRSRDGIPIKATDVRLMFSVFRGDKPETNFENPYPFSKDAVRQIVYKAVSRVTPELPNPSTFEFSWVNNMVGLIRGRLSSFMNQHKLTEYLASIGTPEIEKLKQREGKIFEEKRKLAQLDDNTDEQKDDKPPGFQARYKIKDLFAQFAEEFTNKTRNNGVELHWIGVGTWESPVDIIPEKHLEAWLITQENLKNDSPEEMKKIEQQEFVNKMKELIRKVPINAFDEILYASDYSKKTSYRRRSAHKTDETSHEQGDNTISAEETERIAFEILGDLSEEKAEKDKTIHKDSDNKEDFKNLLARYRNLLSETADLIANKNQAVPPALISAIELLSKTLGYEDFHWVGRSQPETKSDQPEAELYEILVNMVGGDRATAAKWIEYELRRYPDETRSQLIQHAIDSLKRGK